MSLCIMSLLSMLKTLQYIAPVHHVPNGLDIIWADVLVLEVIGVFPYINAEERNKTCRHTGRE